jgi:hypothetical protein
MREVFGRSLDERLKVIDEIVKAVVVFRTLSYYSTLSTV